MSEASKDSVRRFKEESEKLRKSQVTPKEGSSWTIAYFCVGVVFAVLIYLAFTM